MRTYPNYPSPLAGSGEGEGVLAMEDSRQQTPHLPIATQWVPPLPQGERRSMEKS